MFWAKQSPGLRGASVGVADLSAEALAEAAEFRQIFLAHSSRQEKNRAKLSLSRGS
jgi:hypothetical protein